MSLLTHLFGELRGQLIKLSTAAILISLYESPIGNHQRTTKDLFYSHVCSYCMKQRDKFLEKFITISDSVCICKLSRANTHSESSTLEALPSVQ